MDRRSTSKSHNTHTQIWRYEIEHNMFSMYGSFDSGYNIYGRPIHARDNNE